MSYAAPLQSQSPSQFQPQYQRPSAGYPTANTSVNGTTNAPYTTPSYPSPSTTLTGANAGARPSYPGAGLGASASAPATGFNPAAPGTYSAPPAGLGSYARPPTTTPSYPSAPTTSLPSSSYPSYTPPPTSSVYPAPAGVGATATAGAGAGAGAGAAGGASRPFPTSYPAPSATTPYSSTASLSATAASAARPTYPSVPSSSIPAGFPSSSPNSTAAAAYAATARPTITAPTTGPTPSPPSSHLTGQASSVPSFHSTRPTPLYPAASPPASSASTTASLPFPGPSPSSASAMQIASTPTSAASATTPTQAQTAAQKPPQPLSSQALPLQQNKPALPGQNLVNSMQALGLQSPTSAPMAYPTPGTAAAAGPAPSRYAPPSSAGQNGTAVAASQQALPYPQPQQQAFGQPPRSTFPTSAPTQHPLNGTTANGQNGFPQHLQAPSNPSQPPPSQSLSQPPSSLAPQNPYADGVYSRKPPANQNLYSNGNHLDPTPYDPYAPPPVSNPSSAVNSPYGSAQNSPQTQLQGRGVGGGAFFNGQTQQPQQQQQYAQPQQPQQQQQPQGAPSRGGYGGQFDQYGNPLVPSQQQPIQQPPPPQQQPYYEPPAPKKVDRIDKKQIPRPPEFTGNTVRYYTKCNAPPPPATADYTVIDEGNCSPRFIRLTTNNIAHEAELIDSTKLCIGAIIQPLAPLGEGEEAIPVINYPSGPIRCTKCMAYVNPFFQFVDQGNTFICNICQHKNECPEEYKCNLDAHGMRRDKHDRPELCRGSVEFVVGKDFILRPIQDPCFLFVIDVSYGAVVSGLVTAAVDSIRLSLDAMAANPRTRVGIITYDSSIQFYSLKAGRSEPLMLVMSDPDDVFVPCPPDEVLVRISEPSNRSLLDATLDMIPTIFDKESVSTNEQALPVFGAAVQVAAETLMELGGKILILQSNLPQNGAGALTNRDHINLYYTEKEKSLQVPQTSFYQTVATKCAENAITVDIFVCANCYVDIATIGALCEKTGGQVFTYPGFNARKDGYAFQKDLYHDVTRLTGFDAVMIVRVSAGLRVVEHFGNFYHRRVNEMDLPSIDSDKTFGVRFEHEGKLKDKSEACIQCALLYTTGSGERRIRVHTISVPVTSVMSNIFRFADLDAIINLSLKQAVRQLLDTTTCEAAQNALTTACIESLYVYRKFCASATSAGQLILPEPLKLLPLCSLGMIKHPLFQDGISADERSFLYHFVNSMPCYVSVPFVCPRLFALHDMPLTAGIPDKDGRIFLPPALTLSSESVSADGLYLLDDGRFLYIYIGQEMNRGLLEEVFDLTASAEAANQGPVVSRHSAGYYKLRYHDESMHISRKIDTCIDILRKQKASFQNLQIITRRATPGIDSSMESLDESLFFSHLIEDAVVKPRMGGKKVDDKTNVKPPNTMSYIDFLCWIHKRIQNKFM